MLVVLSPAKKLDFAPLERPTDSSIPSLSKDTGILHKSVRRLKVRDLMTLMSISENLGVLNYERFQAFTSEPSLEDSKAAVFAFAGDTYQGLNAAQLDANALAFGQSHLRIISGLYGILRPFDRIMPHRLEMGSRVKTRRGKTLYEFWGQRLAKTLNSTLADHEHKIIVNLASKEYFKAIPRRALKGRVIDVEFREVRDGGSKIISFLAKRARGMMARFILANRIDEPGALSAFSMDNYRLCPTRSTDDLLVFTRPKG